MRRLLKLTVVSLLLLLVAAAVVIYRWTITPYGRLDPEVAVMLHLGPPLAAGEGVSVEAQRQQLRDMMRSVPAGPVELPRVVDRTIPGPAGAIPIRVYHPTADERARPLVVFYHGGGFSLGGLETHDHMCRLLASRSAAIVLAVDYRLAPEHPFPAAVDDAFAAVRWTYDHADELGADRTRIAVAGDSAGGNLAAVTALRARNEGRPPLVFQLLVYPATNLSSFDTVSHAQFAEGFVMVRSLMALNRRRYLPELAQRTHPYASPLLAGDLSRLPAALVITAQFDPLRDEGEAYARRLQEAGVPVTMRRYDGVVHGFFGVQILRKGRAAIDDAALALRHAFAR